MRRKLAKWLSAILMKKSKCLVLLAFTLAVLSISCSEFQKTYTATLTDLGSAQTDWIPFFLMDDSEIRNQAHNVYECHDLDTNETWGYFSVGNKEIIFNLTAPPVQKYNMKKVRKRLSMLGCTANFDTRKEIKGRDISYSLLYDEEKARFYFYGEFRQCND